MAGIGAHALWRFSPASTFLSTSGNLHMVRSLALLAPIVSGCFGDGHQDTWSMSTASSRRPEHELAVSSAEAVLYGTFLVPSRRGSTTRSGHGVIHAPHPPSYSVRCGGSLAQI